MKSIDVEDVYAKNKDIKKEYVKTLQEWAKKQPHLPTITELQFVTFLHSCYFSIEMAKTTIENFYTYRVHCPEFFTNLNFDAVSEMLDLTFFFPLPKLTSEGYHIVFSKLLTSDSRNYVYSQHIKVLFMSIEALLERQGPSEGLVIIIDLKELTFGHLVKVHILEIKKALMYLQEASPVRLKSIYFINVGGIIDSVMAMIKPFLKKDLAKSFFFLDSNYEEMFDKIPRECLPEDYGGKMEPIKVLHENMIKLFKEESEFFKENEKLIANESKRLGKATNVNDLFGVEGSFKKLSID